MEKNIDKILDELILLDPELKSQESRLREILGDIIKNKPIFSISNEFKNNLKNQLLNNFEYKNKKLEKNNYIQIVISFFIWWLTVYSLIWIMWLNVSLLSDQDSLDNIDTFSVMTLESEEFNTEDITPNLMKVDMGRSMIRSVPDEKSNLKNILEKYFIDNWISLEYLEGLLNIINEYINKKTNS